MKLFTYVTWGFAKCKMNHPVLQLKNCLGKSWVWFWRHYRAAVCYILCNNNLKLKNGYCLRSPDLVVLLARRTVTTVLLLQFMQSWISPASFTWIFFSVSFTTRPFLKYWDSNLSLRHGGIHVKMTNKSHWGRGMNRKLILFYSPKPRQVRILIYRNSPFS